MVGLRSLHAPRASALVFAALVSALAPQLAAAQDDPPPVRRSSGGSFRGGVAGSQGIRPVLGVTGNLDVARRTIIGGNKFVFGFDYFLSLGGNLSLTLGLHIGAGEQALVLNPLVDLTYRFSLPIPLVPYIGGGAGLKLGFASGNPTNIGITFRFVSGLEWFFTPNVGLGMQLALPDLGPRLSPDPRPVGVVEWVIGPHFRF